MRGRRTSREKRKKEKIAAKYLLRKAILAGLSPFAPRSIANSLLLSRSERRRGAFRNRELHKRTHKLPTPLAFCRWRSRWIGSVAERRAQLQPRPPRLECPALPLAELAGVPLPGDANREGLASFSLNGRGFGPQGADLAIFAENRPAGARISNWRHSRFRFLGRGTRPPCRATPTATARLTHQRPDDRALAT